MKEKRWDLELNGKLHLIEFAHGRVFKKKRRLLVDGIAAKPLNWRTYLGKTPVTEYPFAYNGHTLTVVLHHANRTITYDLLLDGISVENEQTPDFVAMSQPKSKREKVKETLIIIAIYLLWRLSVHFFFPK
jgi:hypothetical protein